ncbi:hypothetical protein RCK30_26420, partial [Salmonella enterica subsp. enterica serovar Stanley]
SVRSLSTPCRQQTRIMTRRYCSSIFRKCCAGQSCPAGVHRFTLTSPNFVTVTSAFGLQEEV